MSIIVKNETDWDFYKLKFVRPYARDVKVKDQGLDESDSSDKVLKPNDSVKIYVGREAPVTDIVVMGKKVLKGKRDEKKKVRYPVGIGKNSLLSSDDPIEVILHGDFARVRYAVPIIRL